MIHVRNEDLAGGGLLLEVTSQTEGLVPLVEHALVDRPVGRMTSDTAFAHGLVLENERSALRGVTLEAGVVFTEQSCAATLD